MTRLINAPNTPSMPNVTQQALQQQSVHIQTQVQEYEQKSKMSTRVIDETTFRLYFPRNPIDDSLIPTSEPFRSTLSSSIDEDMATSTQGPPMLSIAPSPSLPTMLHDFYLDAIRILSWFSEGTRICRSGRYYEQSSVVF